MSNKEIKFSARLDDSQLTQDIQNFQRKLKELQEASNRQASGMRINQTLVNNGMPAMGNYTQQAYQSAYNSNNNSARQAYAAEVEQLRKLEQVRESLTKKLERQTKIQEMLKEQGKDLLAIEERRADTTERLSRASQAVTNKQTVLNAGSPLLNPNLGQGPQYGPPAPPSMPATPSGLSSIVSALGGASAVIAGIAQAVQVGTSVYRGMAEAPISTVTGIGSAVQGTAGREIAAIYSGRSAIENAYLPEKSKAAAMAGELLRRRENTGMMDIVASITKAGAIGAGSGAGIGAALAGIPSLGLAAGPGAAIGAAIGGLGGTALGIGSALTNKDSLYTIGSTLGIKGLSEARQASLAQQYAEDYGRSFSGIKEMDPLKKEASEQYGANYNRYLQFQRQLGLNYNSFHGEGGFRGYATQNGFSDEQAMSMSGQILSAGGSSLGAGSRNAILGLQAERNFNLTNAGSVLGKLSSTNSNTTENKEALIRILAEGTKLGFDGSHYVEESRKFAENVSEIVSRTGAKTDEEAAMAARNFASFVTDPTTAKGIEGAQSAYERYQEVSSATTGAKGVMRAAGFLSDPTMKGMSQQARINLAGLSEEDLTENNPIVTRAAREAGYTDVGKFIEKVQGINQNAMTRVPMAGIRSKIEAYNKKNNTILSPENYMNSPGEGRQLYEEGVGGIAIDTQGKMKLNELLSYSNRGIYGAAGAKISPNAMSAEAVKTQLESQGKTGKVEDESVKAAAESADFILKNFRSMKDEIVPSAEAIHKFNQGLSEFVGIVNKMPKDFQAQIYSKMNAAQVGGGETAPQGGTPTPGSTGH